jgi:hexokinase
MATTVTATNMTEAQTAAVNKVIDSFSVSTERLGKIADQFVLEMEKGLDHQGATSKFLSR